MWEFAGDTTKFVFRNNRTGALLFESNFDSLFLNLFNGSIIFNCVCSQILFYHSKRYSSNFLCILVCLKYDTTTEFIESCRETAEKFPTSFYGAAVNGRSWAIESRLRRVGGGISNNNSTEDNCWIATQVTSTVSSDGRRRRWQWELRKNRRPPCLGCWRVESIASSDRKGNFEPE